LFTRHHAGRDFAKRFRMNAYVMYRGRYPSSKANTAHPAHPRETGPGAFPTLLFQRRRPMFNACNELRTPARSRAINVLSFQSITNSGGRGRMRQWPVTSGQWPAREPEGINYGFLERTLSPMTVFSSLITHHRTYPLRALRVSAFPVGDPGLACSASRHSSPQFGAFHCPPRSPEQPHPSWS